MKKLLVSGLVAVSSLASMAPMAFASSYSTSVSARDCWDNTRLYVNRGDTLSFRSSGRWSNGGDSPQVVGPNGYSDYYHAYAESDSQPFAALIGKIDNGRPFLVGSHSTWTAGSSGYLYLGMNDVAGTCRDNAGVLNVQIDHRSSANHEVSGTLREASDIAEDVETVIDVLGDIFN